MKLETWKWIGKTMLQVVAMTAAFTTGVYVGIDAGGFVQQTPITMPSNCHNSGLMSGKPYATVNDDGTVTKYYTYDCYEPTTKAE